MKNGPRGPNFQAPNRSVYRFSSIFLKRFCYIHLKLDLQTHWSYFCRNVKERPQRPIFFSHFGPPNESKFRFSNILLKILLWIHVRLALYGHWSYCQRCVKYVPLKGPISGPFWVPK